MYLRYIDNPPGDFMENLLSALAYAEAFLDTKNRATLLTDKCGETVWYNSQFAKLAGIPYQRSVYSKNALDTLIHKMADSRFVKSKLARIARDPETETFIRVRMEESDKEYLFQMRPIFLFGNFEGRIYCLPQGRDRFLDNSDPFVPADIPDCSSCRDKLDFYALKSQSIFMDVFEKSRAPMLIIDGRTLKPREANLAALDFYGYTSEEIKEISVMDIDYRTASFISRGPGAIEAIDPSYTFSHILKSGEERNVKISASVVSLNDLPMILLVITDVTNWINAEKEIKENEERFRFFTDAAEDGVIVMKNGAVTDMNDAFTNLFGWTPEDVLGKEIVSFIPEDERLVFYERNMEKSSPSAAETRFLRKNGERGDVEIRFLPSRYKGEEVTAVLVRDITEKKKTEAAASKNKKRIQYILDAQSVMITVWKKGKIVYCNKSFAGFFQTSGLEEFSQACPFPASLLGKSLGFDNDCDPKDFLNRIKENQVAGKENKISLVSPCDGSVKIFLARLDKIEETDYEVLSMSDISEVENHSLALKNINKFLEKEVEAKINEIRAANIELQSKEQLLIQQSKLAVMGEMISVIAHQWKQPLGAIMAMAQELEDAYSCGALEEKDVRGTVSGILEQVSFMSEIINGFAGFFKPSDKYEEFKVAASIREVERLLSHELNNSRIKVLHEIKGDFSDVTVSGIKNEFKQVVMNLFVNAKDAVMGKRRSSGRNFEGVIKVSAEISEDKVVLRFSDNGGGIGENYLGKLFQPYVTSKGEGGTGLGLHLCKLLVGNMKGSIKAVNSLEGAEFEIILPLVSLIK